MKKAAFFACACALAALVSAACSFEGMAEPLARSVSAMIVGVENEESRNYSALFASQLAMLRGQGIPEEIIAALDAEREEILVIAASQNIPKGRVPFLPVIPLSVMDATRQIEAMRGENRYLARGEVWDVAGFPESRPYYILDVEYGTEMCEKSPRAAEDAWMEGKERRRGLTLAETIALVRHSDGLFLSRHGGVWAVGSRYERVSQVPLAHLNEKGRLSLDWGNVEYADARIGTPSCGFC